MRKTLPNRRVSMNVTAYWQKHAFDVTFGFHPKTMRVLEIFADARKSGQMRADVRAASILASLALQHGAELPAMLKSMERVTDYSGEEYYASPIGEIMAEIIRQLEKEMGKMEAAQ